MRPVNPTCSRMAKLRQCLIQAILLSQLRNLLLVHSVRRHAAHTEQGHLAQASIRASTAIRTNQPDTSTQKNALPL